jgi:hypothetical protein
MKPKIVAVLVVGILTLSVIATGVAAIGQAVADEPGAVSTALVNQANDSNHSGDENNALVSTFKLVCPFH